MPRNRAETLDYFLVHCFDRADKIFASGRQANNQVDLELLADDPVAHALVRRLGTVIMDSQPDFLVAVPNGARWMTRILCRELSLPEIMLSKDEHRDISYANEGEAARITEFDNGVIVEDLFNRYTNTRKVLALPGMGERIVGACALMDRGSPADREALAIPTSVLVHTYIPEQLPPDSAYWKYAKTS